jgi:hypothetical protein
LASRAYDVRLLGEQLFQHGQVVQRRIEIVVEEHEHIARVASFDDGIALRAQTTWATHDLGIVGQGGERRFVAVVARGRTDHHLVGQAPLLAELDECLCQHGTPPCGRDPNSYHQRTVLHV